MPLPVTGALCSRSADLANVDQATVSFPADKRKQHATEMTYGQVLGWLVSWDQEPHIWGAEVRKVPRRSWGSVTLKNKAVQAS